jgi:hypothetical protein
LTVNRWWNIIKALNNEREFEMRGLSALFKMMIGKLGLTRTHDDSSDMQMEACILAEDQGIRDGMAALNIPAALAFDDKLAHAWARGEAIGQERRQSGNQGLSETAALQLIRMRKVI